MMICIAFYKITKIALMLWLAERHDTRKYVNKVVTSEDSLLCAKGQVYLIYPLPWLLRVGNIYKHVGLKFFSVSWHSKQEKSIWFEIVFQWKQTWLRCTTLSNFTCALANHASSSKFHNIRFSIAENSTSLPYFPIPHFTSLHNCLEFSHAPSCLHQAMQTQKTCTEKDVTRPCFQVWRHKHSSGRGGRASRCYGRW